MKLNTPKKTTFWVAVGIAGLSIVLYVLHLVLKNVSNLGAVGYLVLLIGFVFLCLGLILKGW